MDLNFSIRNRNALPSEELVFRVGACAVTTIYNGRSDEVVANLQVSKLVRSQLTRLGYDYGFEMSSKIGHLGKIQDRSIGDIFLRERDGVFEGSVMVSQSNPTILDPRIIYILFQYYLRNDPKLRTA